MHSRIAGPVFVSLVTTFLAVSTSVARGATSLPRATPESQGVTPATLATFLETLDREVAGMHSFMLVRHGRVVAEAWWKPYEAASRHELYSLSKSFTSAAVGFAVAEGRLSVDDDVLKFFPNDAPAESSGNLKAMRVRDLLTMSAGHQDETSSGPDKVSVKSFLAHPVPHKPGTHFKYNTPATFMLSAIVQQQTGQSVMEYLRPRLFEPLGIEGAVWGTNFQGISLGGYGLRVRTEDIAKFGVLHLQKGRWQGKQLLPAEWVDLATSRQVSNGSSPTSDWDQGYGFQFWRCRHGAYRGDGAFGQYCIVLPAQDAVIAITSGVKDMQAVMNQVWNGLLPAFAEGRVRRDAKGTDRLAAVVASLGVSKPAGAASSARAAKSLGRRFAFATNEFGLEWMSLQADPTGGWSWAFRRNGEESRMAIGHADWKRNRSAFGIYPDEPVAGAGAWTAEDTFEAVVCATETPYHLRLTLKFDGDTVQQELVMNVGFGGTKPVSLTGQAR